MAENISETLYELVVIGSSAGGIEALSEVVASLPLPFPVPIVIAQHLDPKRPSYLARILRRHSNIPVVLVEQQENLEAGTVYVVPSNSHVAIKDHKVQILPEGQGRPKPSVDLLMSTAARVYGEKLIAVILTGNGSDGRMGVQMVHESGGTVLAQNPATSAYPGMAQALDPETIDILADLPQIGSIIFNLASGKPIEFDATTNQELGPFLEQLRSYRGLDFRTYKTGTILRRLQRRIVATNTGNLKNYQEYLFNNPEEYDNLINSFLIKVTEFMRDPELFNYLKDNILPTLIDHSLKYNRELRFWSAGCATGQEAYSMAILICEVLGESLKDFSIKIFATDIDANAIAFARRGLYHPDSLERLPVELVQRYFTLEKDGYSVKKKVRELLVFGEHDLSQRAPFPRIDLVMCRNVLIYFSRELQQHALQLFAFALRDGGYLVLGRSESTSSASEFSAIQAGGQHIYQRQGPRRRTQNLQFKTYPKPPVMFGAARQRRMSEGNSLFQMQQEVQQGRAVKENLLLKLPVGVVVVDSKFDIQEINSAARRLLAIHTAAIGSDLVHLSQFIPPRELSTAITRAIREKVTTTLNVVEVPHLTSGEPTFLHLSCYPHQINSDDPNNAGPVSFALVVINDVTPLIKRQRSLEQENLEQVKQVEELDRNLATLQKTNTELEQDNTRLNTVNTTLTESNRQAGEVAQHQTRQIEQLMEASRSLLQANEELTIINNELRTMNEEYLLNTEEAQAAIEEADTLNEEMQATNEELETLNEELQATIEELSTSNADLAMQTDELRRLSDQLSLEEQRREHERAQLAAILSSIGDAVMVVDKQGNILLTNQAYNQYFLQLQNFTLFDQTGAHPIGSRDTLLNIAAKCESFRLTFSLKPAHDSSRWWEALGEPVLQNGEPVLEVVVLRDITERSLRRLQEDFLSLVGHELRTPLTTIKGYSQLIQKWLEKIEAADRPQQGVNTILVQVQQLERLVNELTDLSRMQTGKFNLNFSSIRLDELVGQVVEIARTIAAPQQIELEGAGQPLVIRGDEVRLQQVLFNLLNNAITHAGSSPKIILRLQISNQMAQIAVQDFGPGIDPQELPNLFTRFYQVLHEDQPRKQGLGLGLFISQQIVTAHGGTIRVESTLGEGTVFTVELPIAG